MKRLASARAVAATLLATILVTALGGCATGSVSGSADEFAGHASNGTATQAESLPDLVGNLVADRLGTAAPGALVATGDARLGVAEVVVEEPFRAASGRDCRRLLDASGRPLGRVVCAIGTGHWQLGRPLVAGDPARSIVAVPLVPASRAQ